jgi:LPXTG-motif cell wall-anchored protein
MEAAMRATAWIGILLIVLGVGALAVRGFSFTTEEKVLDIGPIHATADKKHNVYLYPAAGIAAILAGGALVLLGRRRA